MFNFKILEIMNLQNLNLVELNAQKVQEVEGEKWQLQVFKLTITGVLDRIPENITSDCVLFGIKLW